MGETAQRTETQESDVGVHVRGLLAPEGELWWIQWVGQDNSAGRLTSGLCGYS